MHFFKHVHTHIFTCTHDGQEPSKTARRHGAHRPTHTAYGMAGRGCGDGREPSHAARVRDGVQEGLCGLPAGMCSDIMMYLDMRVAVCLDMQKEAVCCKKEVCVKIYSCLHAETRV